MSTSGVKVFAIPELFETILLQLPVRDLLLAQRVSKEWQDMITTSVQIQQALFFKAKPSKTLAANERPELNPFLETLLNQMEDHPRLLGIEMHADCTRGVKYDRMFVDEDTYDDGPLRGDYSLPPCDHAFHLHVEICTTERDIYPEIPPKGSWRYMLATNPPCPLHFIESCTDMHHSECAALTIGEIVD